MSFYDFVVPEVLEKQNQVRPSAAQLLQAPFMLQKPEGLIPCVCVCVCVFFFCLIFPNNQRND